MTLQTAMNGQAKRCPARAWALLNLFEHLAQRVVRDQGGPWLWALARSCELARIQVHELRGLSSALVHPAQVEHEVCSRNCS